MEKKSDDNLPRLPYGIEVKVISGFYQGKRGRVIAEHLEYDFIFGSLRQTHVSIILNKNCRINGWSGLVEDLEREVVMMTKRGRRDNGV